MKQLLSFSSFSVFIILMLHCTLTNCQVQPLNSPYQPYQPKIYNFNLDLDYKERWREFITDYKTQALTFINHETKNIFTKIPSFIYKMLTAVIDHYHDQEFVQECTAIAELLDISPFEVFLINNVYEISSAFSYSEGMCTSTVVQNSQKQIFHGRNLDAAQGGYFANITAQGNFYKNGELVYQGIVSAGMIGQHTALKPNKFAVSIDEKGDSGLLKNIFEIIFNKKSYNVIFLLKKVMETANSYDEAVEMLSNTPIDADVYFIVSGNQYNQGTIITITQTQAEDLTTLNNNQNWFIVETNYDQNRPDPVNDYRRIPTMNHIQKLSYENINAQNLFDNVMSKYPTLNDHTMLTTIMSAQSNIFNTTFWW